MKSRGVCFCIVFEVDVGMYCGGIEMLVFVFEVMVVVLGFGMFMFEGIMGYEVYILVILGFVGGVVGEVRVVRVWFVVFVGVLLLDCCKIINSGGSKMVFIYVDLGVVIELLVGFVFVKFMDFDMDMLVSFKLVIFIVILVLKVVDVMLLGFVWMILVFWVFGLFRVRGCFFYGGYWMVKLVYL